MKKFYFILLGFCILIGSCSTGDTASAAISQMFGKSTEALVFYNCKASAEDEIEFEFSQPVTVTSINFSPELPVASIENGSVVKIRMEENIAPGIRITADILAEDTERNTINVLVTLTSRNNQMPSLVINELRTEYSNPRVEFIEFKMKSAGNLGAMRVLIAGGSQTPYIYEFAPVEVKAGEYVVLHLRKREPECKDELGTNLAESGGTGSSPTARDFWVPDTAKRINKASGFVYVIDQDDNVLDAIMHSETPDEWWKKDYLAEAAEFLFRQGAWLSPDGKVCRPIDAINSTGTTATRSISRDETAADTNSAREWYITATSGATPGTVNDPRRFNP